MSIVQYKKHFDRAIMFDENQTISTKTQNYLQLEKKN